MNNKKQFAINLLASVVGFIVNVGIGFFLTPYIVKSVGVEAYGFVALGNNFISYASLATIALNSMAARFITIEIHRNNWAKANEYFSSVTIANCVIAVIMLIPAIFCIMKIDKIIDVPVNILFDVKLLFIFLFANFIISIIVSALSVATFTTNRLDLQSMRSIEANIIRAVVLVVLFVFFKPSVSFLGFTTFITLIYATIFNIHYTKKLLPKITIKKSYFSIISIKELVSSGVWNVFNKLSDILSQGLDLLIANLFISASAMGTLSLSKTIPTLTLSLFGTMTGVFAPSLFQSYAKNEFDSMKRQLSSAIKFLSVLSSIPLAILFVYGSDFFRLWVPTQDSTILQILTIITCVDFIFVLPLEPLWQVFTVTNKLKTSTIYLFINSILTILLVFVGVSIFKSPTIKMVIIAGVSTVIGVIRALSFLPLVSAKLLNYEWYTFYPHIIRNVLAVALTTLASFGVKRLLSIGSWANLALAALMTCVLGLVINVFITLGKSERVTAKNFIVSKYNSIRGKI